MYSNPSSVFDSLVMFSDNIIDTRSGSQQTNYDVLQLSKNIIHGGLSSSPDDDNNIIVVGKFST